MRAVAIDSYGGPEVLRLQDVPDPKVGPDSALVEVAAASINPVDYRIMQGYLDAAFPVVFPLTLGWDVAGKVVAAGPAVRSVHVGQDVIGYARMDFVGAGTWADRVAVPARGVAPAPPSLDAAGASCLPLAGLTAYQSLVEVLQVGQGDTVLVHAASGGVGHLAVQIALAQGARVIGSASARNADFLRGLGAEPVEYGDGLVDAVRALAPHGVDAGLDLAGGPGLEQFPELVRTPGRFVSIVDADAVQRLGGTYVFVRPDAGHLGQLAALVDAGRLQPVVQATHALADVRTAVEEAMGGVRGKVVLTREA